MPAKFEIKLAKNNQYFFHLLAANGEIILVSEMYKTKASAKKGICSVQKNACDEGRFDRKDNRGRHHFVLKAGNHQVIGTSQVYKSAAAMEKGIRSVKKCGVTQRTDDLC